MTDHNQRSGSKKLLVIATVLFLTGIGTVAVLVMSSDSKLNSRIAALRKAGVPMSGEELNDFYVVPAKVPDSTMLWQEARKLVQTKSFRDSVASLPILGRGEEIPAPGEDWKQLEECKTAINSVLSKEMSAVRKAIAVGGHARFPVDFTNGVETLLVDTQEMRTYARLLALDANVAAHEGDAQRVVDDIKGMFVASEVLAQEPTLISQLVRIAIFNMAVDQGQRLLPHCDLSDSQLAELQATVLQSDLRNGLKRGLIGERAMGIELIGNLTFSAFRSANQNEALTFYEGAVQSLDQSWKEARTWQSETDDRFARISQGTISKIRYQGVLLALPAIMQATSAAIRTEASQRSFVIALAAMRQKIRDGKYPESIAEVEMIGEGIDLTDPFTGEEMLIKLTDDSITFYSVGENEKDDGGEVTATSGRAPDVGFQLPSAK